MDTDPLWSEASLVLEDACAQLCVRGLTRLAAHAEPHAGYARRLLARAPTAAAYVEVVMLEFSLVRLVYPVLIAGHATFRRPVPRLRVTHQWAQDPPLGAWLAGDAPLATRRWWFTPRVRPTSFADALVHEAWPLLDLVDSPTIGATVVSRVEAWLAAGGA